MRTPGRAARRPNEQETTAEWEHDMQGPSDFDLSRRKLLLGTPENLHPMQAAFVKHDGYQCGYCTPGQICSAVAVLDEIKAGIPSHVSADLNAAPQPTNAELRERMSGNICRCGAYSNIAEAISEVAGRPA